MKFRSGYSVLELLIALGLLVTLMAVAWSLMGTYRDAERRGWEQAYRMRVARVARMWLEEDAASGFVGDGADRQADIGAKQGADSKNIFHGTSQGFSWRLAPSLDPLPWLDEVTAGFQPLESSFDLEGEDAEHVPPLVDPLVICEVRYRLEVEGTSPEGETIYQLTRELWSESLWSKPTIDEPVAADRVLTTEDLYRVNDPEMESVDPHSRLVSSDSLRYLVSPTFRYFDGSEWRSSWDSSLQGRPPSAIELSFDFPPSSTPWEQLVENSEADGEGFEAEREVDRLGAVLELAGEDMAATGETVPERDARVVVRPWSAAATIDGAMLSRGT